MKFQTALCQMRTELDDALTMDKAEDMVRKAAQNGAQVVCLPEMFSCPYDNAYFAGGKARQRETVASLSAWARANRVILIGGSIPEEENGRLYNTSFIFNGSGEMIARHRKIHLFDVDLPGMRFQESASFSAGEEITVFDTPFGRFGVAICFDVRFPELFRAMARRGAEMIFCRRSLTEKPGLPTGRSPCACVRWITKSLLQGHQRHGTKAFPMNAGAILWLRILMERLSPPVMKRSRS